LVYALPRRRRAAPLQSLVIASYQPDGMSLAVRLREPYLPDLLKSHEETKNQGRCSIAMLYQALVWGLACYALIGITIAAIGPVRRLLDEATADLRKAPAADDDSDARMIPPLKVVLFRAVMSLAIGTLWPRFLIFVMRRSESDLTDRSPQGDTLGTLPPLNVNRPLGAPRPPSPDETR